MRRETIFLMKVNYNVIDLTKFIMSILVIILHIEPLIDTYPSLNHLLHDCITRTAVPYFFIAAGFFLYRKMSYEEIDLAIIRKYLLRIFRIYSIWSIIYLPFILRNIPKSQDITSICIFLIREFFIVGSYVQLWFLPALIVAIIIITFLTKCQIKFRYIFLITGVSYLLGLLDQSYYGIFNSFWPDGSKLNLILENLQTIFGTTRNGFCFGALFVAIGAYISFNHHKTSVKLEWPMLFIFSFLFLIEFILLDHLGMIKEANMYIFLVPLTVSIFLLSKEIKLTDSWLFLRLRQMSMLIYYEHIFIAESILLISQLLEISVNRFTIFILTTFLTLLSAEIIIRLSDKEKFKFLKWLY